MISRRTITILILTTILFCTHNPAWAEYQNGLSLLASTFVGGNGEDESYEPCLAIDSQGNVFFTGETYSNNFPTTAGAYDRVFGGASDRVVAKFNPDLSVLLAATFIGGSNIDRGMGICIDDDDNVYLAGYTASTNFPTTSQAYDRTYNGGGDDAYVAKFDNDLTTLLGSTYYGGNNLEGGDFCRIDIGIDSLGNVLIAGLTNSSNLTTTPGAYDRTYNGSQDIFVAKFSSDLSSLIQSTFLGGSTDEWRPSLQIDGSDNVFVSGTTRFGFPTTPGAFDRTFNGGGYDMFAAKLSPDLDMLLAGTYLGSNADDNLKGIRLDAEGNLYTAGLTAGTGYPTTSGAYDRTLNGSADFAISKLDNNLSELLASTFLGGSDHDDGEDVYLDSQGNVHVFGSTRSTNFPVTPDAYDTSYNGGSQGQDTGYVVLDGDLTTLVYCTYFGGGAEKGKGLVIDAHDKAYLTGITFTPQYPTTPGAFDTTFGYGTTDAFIACFGSQVSAAPEESMLQRRHHLEANFPNPFNPSTTITYRLEHDCQVTLSVHNLRGQLVTTLVNEMGGAGNHSVTWNGHHANGAMAPSGIYSYRLRAGDQVEVRLMSLVK